MIINPIYLWGILCSRDSVYLLYLNYISYARVIMKNFRFGSLTPDLLTQHLMSETSINFIRNWLVWSFGPKSVRINNVIYAWVYIQDARVYGVILPIRVFWIFLCLDKIEHNNYSLAFLWYQCNHYIIIFKWF